MANTAWYALVIVSFLLVGVPSNVAVLWIHTRKNSRVAKNRFPLIFAAIDLFALVAPLPINHFVFGTGGEKATDFLYLNVSFGFCVNGYLLTLFMATIDKFYSLMFPFKYGKKRATIFKTAVTITTVPNAAWSIGLATIFEIFGRQGYLTVIGIYNIITLLAFLAISVLYILIIAELIRNQRSLRKVNVSG